MSLEEKVTQAAHGDTGVSGHEATRFEPTDARPGLILWSLGIIAGTLVIVFAITVGIQRYLYDANPQGDLPSPLAPERVLPPNPQIEVHPWEELPVLRAHEEKILHSYGRDAAGRIHIPIDQAMADVIPRLNIRPGSPPGSVTPGGEGREFGHGHLTAPTPFRIEIKAGSTKNNAQ